MHRLLCITAHPDDEAGSFGGSLLLYGEQGVETHVLCLTSGEAGSHRGAARSDAELAQLRRREFAASCAILKVSHAEVLDYPDRGLKRLDFYQVVKRLVEHIRRVRPQVVMSFGPEGGLTGHPDHSMVSLFTTAAFHWAGRENFYPDGLQPHRAQKLYYATAAFLLSGRAPLAPPPATAVIDVEAYVDRKLEAFRAHLTQAPLVANISNVMRSRGGRELFHLASATSPGFLQAETDLFTGVGED